MIHYPDLCMMIDGERVSGGARRTHAVLNPANGDTLGQLPLAEVQDLDRALAAAAGALRYGAIPHRSSAPRCFRARPG
jgi:succinate-semialdehyde dehydrogenase/glutarate-semialdehyde dehydrogenase